MKDDQGQDTGIEKVRSQTIEGNQHLMLVAQALCTFLSEVRTAGEALIGLMLRRVRSVWPDPQDLAYRFFEAMRLWADRLLRWTLRQWVRGP